MWARDYRLPWLDPEIVPTSSGPFLSGCYLTFNSQSIRRNGNRGVESQRSAYSVAITWLAVHAVPNCGYRLLYFERPKMRRLQCQCEADFGERRGVSRTWRHSTSGLRPDDSLKKTNSNIYIFTDRSANHSVRSIMSRVLSKQSDIIHPASLASRESRGSLVLFSVPDR